MTILSNKQVNFEYELNDKLTAGISLLGTEVKSLRAGKASLLGSFVTIQNSKAAIKNLFIAQYDNAPANTHSARRDRELLLTKNQLKRLIAMKQSGQHIVPIRILTKGRFIKVEIGIGRSKKMVDKRQALKKRQAEREVRRETKLKSRS